MSAGRCDTCEGLIYQAEPQVKCLGKIWHKGCFKCTICSMTLNLKNFKGFEKNPYCEAHTPKPQSTFTAIAPEYIRWQENSRIQSDAAYKAEFNRGREGREEELNVHPAPFMPVQPYQDIEDVASNRSHSRSPSQSSSLSQSSMLQPQPHPQQMPLPSSGSGGILKKKEPTRYSALGEMPVEAVVGPQPEPNRNIAMPISQSQSQMCYRAVFGYDSMDTDEVGFVEGDFIVDCTPVDQGWLTGTVYRTGRRGMLPANYVIYTHFSNNPGN